jgi:hypothetical protein
LFDERGVVGEMGGAGALNRTSLCAPSVTRCACFGDGKDLVAVAARGVGYTGVQGALDDGGGARCKESILNLNTKKPAR